MALVHDDRLIEADSPFVVCRVNILGTLNVFEAARLFRVERVVHFGAVSGYGDVPASVRVTEGTRFAPTSVYGATKAAVDVLGAAYASDLGEPRTAWVATSVSDSRPVLTVPRNAPAAVRAAPPRVTVRRTGLLGSPTPSTTRGSSSARGGSGGCTPRPRASSTTPALTSRAPGLRPFRPLRRRTPAAEASGTTLGSQG